MIDAKEIGKTIVVERELIEVENELRKDIRLMQDAYATLRDMPDYQCPVALSELNAQEIDRLTAQRVSRVEADESLLPSEKEQRIKVYKNLHRAVVTQINVITKVIARWPDAEFVYSDSMLNIVPMADLKLIVEKRCVRQVPELCKQHARLIVNVFQSIAKLREFEKSEGVSKLRLENLYNLSSERLAEVWADGTIMQPVLDMSDGLSRNSMYNRRVMEDLYL
jgi:hypothetical protein